MSTYPYARNLGYFAQFMKQYGRATPPTRAELYQDTQAYSYGRETAQTLYDQVYNLLGVSVPSPQVYVGP